jgi:sterol 24-C-methyltransferase
MKVIDLGCGIGGPMRNIARFSGCSVVGVNNNDYQLKRCNRLNEELNMADLCKGEKGDFLALDYPKESFDAAFSIEGTIHAPERVKVYEQIFQVIKPGGMFAAYEWAMTDKFDSENPEHRTIKRGIEEGGGLPSLPHYSKIVEALKEAGFEVVNAVDIGLDTLRNNDTWYSSFQGGSGLQSLPQSKIGSRITHSVVSIMESIGIAPKGSTATHTFLLKGRDSLQLGGETGIFTPLFFILARKPSQ